MKLLFFTLLSFPAANIDKAFSFAVPKTLMVETNCNLAMRAKIIWPCLYMLELSPSDITDDPFKVVK